MPVTTRVMSTDETSNINVKAAFIHVIGDLLQSFGVLIAAYIIFYKVLLLSGVGTKSTLRGRGEGQKTETRSLNS